MADEQKVDVDQTIENTKLEIQSTLKDIDISIKEMTVHRENLRKLLRDLMLEDKK